MKETSPRVAAYLLLLLALQQWVAPRLVQSFSLLLPYGIQRRRPRPQQRLYSTTNNRPESTTTPAPQEKYRVQTVNQDDSSSKRNTKEEERPNTPYQVLYPYAFPVGDPVTGHDRVLGLHGALEVLKQAVQSLWLLAAGDDDHNNNNNESVWNEMSRTRGMVRLEHTVRDNVVDPLAWLHAQQKFLLPPGNQQQQQEQPALFFLQTNDEDGGWQVAALGAARVVNRTSDVFAMEIPPTAHWYGGARFDDDDGHHHHPTTTSPKTNSDIPAMTAEWQAFGAAYWMLPVVELRRSTTSTNGKATMTLAVNLVLSEEHQTWADVARTQTWPVLQALTDRCSARVPPTTLPPVLVRDSNIIKNGGPELYEQAVAEALTAIHNETALQKVVLARLQQMHLGAPVTALDVLRRWKYGGHEGGHVFYLRPASSSSSSSSSSATANNNAPEFFGCTPERLFRIRDGHLQSEALAGTRPRGSTQQADETLLRELFASPKDQNENLLTGQFIQDVFADLERQGSVVHWNNSSTLSSRSNDSNQTSLKGEYFVRRLLHLQHICRRYSAQLKHQDQLMSVTQQLLSRMHPTPAVCGLPQKQAQEFIRQYESTGFDRGFYAGPVGCIGREMADIFVAIRSGLVTRSETTGSSTVSVYAGSGIVPGSTFQGEWAETNCKFEVISSLFPASPFTLQSAPNANVAWAAAFVEELIRNGVTRFYVCPGSRSTPLVVAIARAARTHVGIVQAVSVHDERAAAFRAVGYGRGAGRPAAVITSSGTAVANLYPAIVEASMDGIPLLALTADRPYESRDSGANQAIDQAKVFAETYIRWFRDILPPSDDVPVSVGLSDAGHAVAVSKKLRGPVHVNVQFRENLAPEAGPIRNDGRVDSTTEFNGPRFTDSPGFARWSTRGERWTQSYHVQDSTASMESVVDVARLVERSRRGIIVVGNLRLSTAESEVHDQASLSQLISDFAQEIGLPIFAGAQSALLRFSSPAVIPFAEHLLKCPVVAENIEPDFVLQIGAPLVSTEISSAIKAALKENSAATHILVHPNYGRERVNADFTVTHSIQSEIAPFLRAILHTLKSQSLLSECGSELTPLIQLGRRLQPDMKSIIRRASETISSEHTKEVLSEPEIALAVSEIVSMQHGKAALFLSNSMPIRDAEFFFYPFARDGGETMGLKAIGSNRGASGIDGIISSAKGFAEAIEAQTTLLIGDLSTLHDLNSMHGLGFSSESQLPGQGTNRKRHGLTTVIVNNDGGGIFSFLPIAKYGADVSFEEFFGTKTNSFSFEKGAEAFGLPFRRATDYLSFSREYAECLVENNDSVLEAVVAGRSDNVEVHKRITQDVVTIVSRLLSKSLMEDSSERLPVKWYARASSKDKSKTLVLLHGWMGDKSEWDAAGLQIAKGLGEEWDVLSIDLPGHGASARSEASELESIKRALRLDTVDKSGSLNLESKAMAVLRSLLDDHGVVKINSVAGFSLGGRVALEMKRLCKGSSDQRMKHILDGDSKMILLGAFPGNLQDGTKSEGRDVSRDREEKDDGIARKIRRLADRSSMVGTTATTESRLVYNTFLHEWYRSPIWGSVKRNRAVYSDMVTRRSVSLGNRGRDLACSISQCSPSRNSDGNWKLCSPENTLFVAGAEDLKYTSLGQLWAKTEGVAYRELPHTGHAVLVESPFLVASSILEFLQREPPHQLPDPASNVMDRSGEKEPKRRQDLHPKPAFSPSNVSFVGSEMFATIESLDFEAFAIDFVDNDGKGRNIGGIGWGQNAQVRESNIQLQRNGFVIQIESNGGREVGLGEVSPLEGLHAEDLEDARKQLVHLKNWIENAREVESLQFSCSSVLALEGSLGKFLDNLAVASDMQNLHPSVRSGLEMALLALSSQRTSAPIHQALQRRGSNGSKTNAGAAVLRVNGLVTRGATGTGQFRLESLPSQSFPSLKVKVGHQTLEKDTSALLLAFHRMDMRRKRGKIRADANRAWNESQAMSFASSLDGLDVNSLNRIEFVEEPLRKVEDSDGLWSLEQQIQALERWYLHTEIPYALDESIADLSKMHDGDFGGIKKSLSGVFQNKSRGCACFILKPALIGVELSIQIARFCRFELGIGAVFSSSFDSGIGLTHTALLGFLSDQVASTALTYPHGVGTYLMLQADTLAPPFASYVNDDGLLNIPPLSRALYGLSLEELRDSMESFPLESNLDKTIDTTPGSYKATTATSSTGKEINVVVSFPLPFPADTAAAKFTDLPQQSRWSPWISSVEYQGVETEWTLNVRGIPLSWRATSQIISDPWPGIEWRSVSGVKNRGSVEFVPDDPSSTCHMNVRMTIVPPRLLRPLFQGTSVFLEDFLREKLLKWSLEMFRDVVKADIALERGEVELGDALFEAVEGKASAIEATLDNIPPDHTEDECTA